MNQNKWEVFGQDWAVNLLQQHVSRGGLRHAYLISGPIGIGRRTLALRLAQALNCATPIAPGVPCRTCRTCKQIEAGQHADLMVIKKLPDKKDLGVDQIREVSRFLSLKPYMSPYKVVLVINFEDASPSAQNALLKTLEEAPDYGVLLLTAENNEQLLPTIVSRCEILRLRPAKVDDLAEFLAERGMNAGKARLLAHLSSGCPGLALRLESDTTGLSFRTEKLDDLHSLLAARRIERFHFAEKLDKENKKRAKGKEKDKDDDDAGKENLFRQTLLIWLSYWRDVLLKASNAQADLTNIDRTEEIETLAYALDRSRTRSVVVDLVKALDRLDKNVNPRLLTEVTLMDWPKVK